MARQEFATLVFEGDRFKAAMPVQALPELAAYQELVLAVAKGLFAARNPQRKNVPRGFADSFRLVLDRVEGGSAVPVLLRETTPTSEGLLGKLGHDFYDQARDVVERSIRAVAEGREIPSEMPRDALAKFNAFGRTLADDEAIVVAPPASRQGARYTREIRRKLVLHVRSEFEEPVTLVGWVVTVGREPALGFVLRTAVTYQRLDVRSSNVVFERAVRALKEETPVLLVGTGLFDATGKLTKVTEVSDLSSTEGDTDGERPGCRVSLEEQVRSLEGLAPGWYDADSPAFDPAALTWTAQLFRGVVESFDLPTPYVYPTPEGEVRAEWSGEPWEVAVIVDTRTRRSEAFATEVSTGEVHENSFTLSEAGAESKMGRFLAQHFHGRFAG